VSKNFYQPCDIFLIASTYSLNTISLHINLKIVIIITYSIILDTALAIGTYTYWYSRYTHLYFNKLYILATKS